MSEYQYYEFQALDRPLTQREMRELRKHSTRATINDTRFVNHYEWGNFKGAHPFGCGNTLMPFSTMQIGARTV